MAHADPHPRTWLGSDARLARVVGRPVQSFLAVEAAGGILLVAATVVALVWANSPWRESYEQLVHTHLSIAAGSFHIDESLQHVVNDGLMALFFFVVGLEIKRELVAGELRDRRAAVLPVVAALGGMVVPAAVFLAFNLGGRGEHGWGIPMATDIAFALGVVALLGKRVPAPLKVFLLTLAIVDDIGAIVVIAVFYSDGIRWTWFVEAVVVLGLVVLAKRARVRSLAVYVVLGVAAWLFVFESGVHATIAGVVLGLLTPARPLLPEPEAEAIVDQLEGRTDLTAADVRRVEFLVRESVPPTERLEHALHPWTSYVIVPLFAFANAGIVLSGDAVTDPSAVLVGVVLGLVAGKTVGISVFSWAAVKLGWGVLPEGVRFSQLVGVAALGGIGFTVSLFITALAFEGEPGLADQAKIGILVASVAAAAIGSVALTLAVRRTA
ncbi:MAG: Na+/H+ antiporter NhaA [Ilumatobacteraceae bacterium]|nr:Na+/H+ antiporter NhaA [Ilumatobacteraceae bacterium]